MADKYTAPWHKISFDRFLTGRLPALLAERLPLARYAVYPEGEHSARVTVELSTNGRALLVEYPGLPTPDEQGLFWLEGEPLFGGPRAVVPFIVVPTASTEELAQAEMRCVGEQMYDYIAARLGQAPGGLAWDEAVARALLPLDMLFNDFLSETAQLFDVTNWHSRQTHQRRILIPSRQRVIAPGQMGRVDPFETPEGPNIGRVFTVALGAEIRDGRLVITDHRPEAGLGPNAAQIPFLEHNDANRLLMGVNMMRQGLVPPEPEPALVQTGREPANAGADLWCGRNLLTAFIAWSEGSTEDGLILSETCAQRLNYPYPAQAGDKLSNRHGTKGVVSQVLPDAQMPHLADGTPVEIVFSFTGLHARGNFGQVREAVMGRIARAEGQPAIVPPFHAPDEEEIRARLAANGLPADGMERLRVGRDGPEMTYPATVGYVYWYRLAHLAQDKLRVVGAQPGPLSEKPIASDQGPAPLFMPWENGQALGEREIAILRQAGARRNALEALTTRSAAWAAGESTTRTAADFTPSPYFQALARRLAAAGIAASLEGGQLALRFAAPQGEEAYPLATALPHPWLRSERIQVVARPPAGATPAVQAAPAVQQAFGALAQANERLARWLEAQQPGSGPADREVETGPSAYLNSLYDQLETRLAAYLDALLPPEALRFAERQAWSARAVISPGVGMRLDQVGLPERIAQVFFGGQAEREQASIDEVMARAWVIVFRAPALAPTALLAFHPVRVPDPTIRLHPQATTLLNADFDGDQVAVFLPLSAEAQQEAGEKLSVAAQVQRNPDLVPALLPPHEGIWGLAHLSLERAGRRSIAETLGMPDGALPAPAPQADLAAGLRRLIELEGIERGLRAAEALAHLGYAAADASGASLSPFAHTQVPLPPPPARGDAESWEAYIEACAEAILSGRDYANPNLGPQLLSAAVRPRSRRYLPILVGPRGRVINAEGQPVIVRRSVVEGRTPQELYATVSEAREGLAKLAFEGEEILQESASPGSAITLLARARRSKRPGLIFARAAASGETDPLTDEESRLLVGMPVP